jgi:hypothetical protein
VAAAAAAATAQLDLFLYMAVVELGGRENSYEKGANIIRWMSCE